MPRKLIHCLTKYHETCCTAKHTCAEDHSHDVELENELKEAAAHELDANLHIAIQTHKNAIGRNVAIEFPSTLRLVDFRQHTSAALPTPRRSILGRVRRSTDRHNLDKLTDDDNPKNQQHEDHCIHLYSSSPH